MHCVCAFYRIQFPSNTKFNPFESLMASAIIIGFLTFSIVFMKFMQFFGDDLFGNFEIGVR